MPLAIAGHVGAAEDVKRVLYEGHRDAVTGRGLWDVATWGVGAVRSVLEAQPEVSAPCLTMAASILGCDL